MGFRSAKASPVKQHDEHALQLSILRKSGDSQRLLVAKRLVMAGRKKKNDIVIRCSLKRFNLLKKRGNGYELFVPAGSTGTVHSEKAEPLSLDSLRDLNLLPQKRGGHILHLSPGTRAELSFENCRINVEYVPVPPPSPRTAPESTLPKEYRSGFLEKDQKGFWVMFLISFFVHVSFLLYCTTVPLPSAYETTLSDVPERFVKLIIRPKSMIPFEEKLQKTLEAKKPKPKAAKKPDSPKKESPGAAKKTEKTKRDTSPSAQQKPSLIAKTGEDATSMDNKMDITSIGILGQISSGEAFQPESTIDSQIGLLAANTGDGRETILHNVEKILPKEESLADPGDEFLLGEEDSTVLSRELDDLVTKHQQTDTVELPTRGDVSLQKIIEIKTSGAKNKLRASEVILQMAGSYKAGITQCYNNALVIDPNLNGRVVVEFTITATGDVERVKIIASTLTNPDTGLEACVINMIKHWTFPEIPQGTTTVVYPFVFFPVL